MASAILVVECGVVGVVEEGEAAGEAALWSRLPSQQMFRMSPACIREYLMVVSAMTALILRR